MTLPSPLSHPLSLPIPPAKRNSRQRPYYLTADGRRVPRLTRILSILREPDIDAKVLTEAATRGIALHRMIAETISTGKLAKLPRGATWEVRQAWIGWLNWWAIQPKPFPFVGVEQEALSMTLGYGATLDLVERDRVTEWKVTSAIRAKHWVQLHAQVPLIVESDGRKEVKVRVVRLDSRIASYEEEEQGWNEEVWLTFMKLRDIYASWYTAEYRDEGEE